MATSGAKPYFSFLMFAFFMATIAAGGQALVAWRHPDALGHEAMYASAQAGHWGAWIHFGVLAIAAGGSLVLFLGCLKITDVLDRRAAAPKTRPAKQVA